jgi:hypothetical protein
MWGGYQIPGYWNNINDAMAQQIFAVCREKSVTIQEIADEIGVAPLYFEDKLNYLLENKFLKETSKGKYITDFIILPQQIMTDFNYEQSLVYKNIGEEIHKAVVSVKDEILSLDFYGNRFEYNYLMWVLYVYASQAASDMMQSEYNKKWKGKIPENNGKNYRLAATVTMPDENIDSKNSGVGSISWSNMHQHFAAQQYSHVEYANLFEMSPFGDRDSMVTDKNINLLMKIYDDPAAELTLTEEEQVANLILNGLAAKKDGKLYLNMPVMTYDCKSKIEAILKKAVLDLTKKYVKELSELGEKYLRPHIREDMLEEYVHWIMSAVFYPLHYVMYYGMEGAKTLAIPEDYEKSAAGLCLYIRLPTPVDAYNDKLFNRFFRIIDKMRTIQKDKKFDISKIAAKIERIVNQKFTEIDDKSVYFGQVRQELPDALKIREICADNLFINIAEFSNRNEALSNAINGAGANITPEVEEINGKQRALYNVNASYVGKTPVTLSATFVKDNIRVSLTAKCPDYVVRGIDYPANALEMSEYIHAANKRIEEEGVTWEDIDRGYNISPQEDFLLKYSEEILSTQQKIEDVLVEL